MGNDQQIVRPKPNIQAHQKIVLKQSDNQYKSLVVDVAKQECLSQPFINNSNTKTQSTDSEGVILQGVQRDNGDAARYPKGYLKGIRSFPW